MSQNLRVYESNDESKQRMYVTACIGPNFDNSVQFTIGRSYCVLTEKQTLDLISTLLKRLTNEWSATGYEAKELILVKPYGLNEKLDE